MTLEISTILKTDREFSIFEVHKVIEIIDDFFINQAEKLRDVLYFSNKETRKEQVILEQVRFEFIYE